MSQAIFAITRLDAAHAVFVPVATAFLPEVSGTLSNFGTDADGFDSLLSDALLSVDADHAAVQTLIQNAADADFVPGDFANVYHTPLAGDIAAFQATGDTLADQTTTATTPPGSDPAPAPAPAPGGGVGAGGGGGVGAGAGGGVAPGGGGAGGGSSVQCTFHPDGVGGGSWSCEEVASPGPGFHPPLQP